MPSDWFTAHAPALPTEAEEIWRYSRISELDLGAYSPAAEAGGEGVPAEVESLLAAIGPRSGLAVTRNGHVVVSENVTSCDEVDTVAHQPDAFAVLNSALAPCPLLIDVPNGKAFEQPFVVVHWIDGDGAAVFPRTVVRVGEAA